MHDPRVRILAKNLINQSVRLKPGEKILIENIGLELPLVTALVEEAQKAGGLPYVWIKDPAVERRVLMGLTEDQATLWAENEAHLMREMQAYVGLRSSVNIYEMSDVPADKTQLYMKRVWHPVHHEIRVAKTKWVVLRYPSPAMAQNAGMSTEAFENFYFDVCCLDYGKMGRAMDALVRRMERADKVRILGPGTDLRFSIKGLPAIKCAGEMNIPDGEVYTAPVRTSVNGTVSYNAPSPHDGFTYENVRLTFRDGKIIDAAANDTERVNKVFDTDEGARYVGEFALGVNPFITFPMKDILFDEKIAGSFHFTPGACYEECDNGNQSALHWDLVCIQTPEYGGGEIWFDGELIRKDGLFVTEDLAALNPEALR